MTGVNGGQVTNAKLCLYNVDGANEGGDFYHVSNDSWQEETVTWNNAPAAEGDLLASLGDVNPDTWYEVNLTSHITADGTYSLRISDSVGGADYSSKEGSNAPKLLVSVGGATPQSCTGTATTTPTATLGPTNTPTLTPTPGPSPTPTAPFTPTPTQILSIFSNAVFTYDGDGKRVKSVITTNVGTTTTYFVGTYYEVADGVVTKYYYAGAQRIAMRANGTLNYLLGDHLGSTSLTADASGQVVSELRYTAWGEVRHASGNTATKYQYTGQYSYAGEFGLHFYNARWYDSSLGRFAQADMIVPGAGNPQAWDRYAYVLNNPLRYTDPTGHLMTPYDGGGGGSGSYTPPCSIFTNICNGGSSNNNGGGGSGSGGCNSLSCVITGGNQGSGNGGSSSGSSGGGGCTSLACVLNNGNPGGNVFGGGGCNSLGCVVNNGSSESNEAIYSCDDPKLGCVTDVGGTWQDPAVYISIAVGGWASGLFSTAFWGSATACIANPVCRWVTGMAGGVGGAGTQDISILVRQAQQQYPNKAGQIQLHHVFPVYLGGDPNGTRVAIDAAYHQVITNAFRALWPYGQGAPTAEQAQRIMQQVYERFPLP